MEGNTLFTAFSEGRIARCDGETDAAGLAWHPHPAFKGVALKHLAIGEATGGRFSCHLVRIEPGCAIGTHVHEGKWELHEVLGGEGRCRIEAATVDYRPGVCGLLPENREHSVEAGKDGLLLFAVFAPALL
jgi:mannose-6-phosphate isomerase-like protein (cupin superfamily)